MEQCERKEIIKINLDNKIIGSKPLFLNDSLSTIREKIKAKTKEQQFSFLDKQGKVIKKDNEAYYKLDYILYDKNIIKLKNDNFPEIKILMNNICQCKINISKESTLILIRSKLENILNFNFIFLDEDGNEIELEDENDFTINNIIQENNEINILSQTFKDAPPAFINDNHNYNDGQKTPKPNIIYKCKETIEKKVFNNLVTIHHFAGTKPINVDKNINEPKYKNVPYFYKKEINLKNFEILETKNDITIYKYSKIKANQPLNLKSVYLHYFDKYNIEDDEEKAYVVLFCGKTGDGKTTAINAFFNIIKGVKKEDKYRFILISEPERSQVESQTEGVHLYFVKDINNTPIIIIDSQGFGDTRGTQYDERINEAFNYIFTNLITHINCVSFIVKANDARIFPQTRYIFNCVTSLFADDITKNFIVNATHASYDTIENGPQFINSIKKEKYLKVNEREDKWWYSFDSKSIFSKRDKRDEITQYSFDNLNQFYEKIKILGKKSIRNTSELLNKRIELKIKTKILKQKFQDLLEKQKEEENKRQRIEELDYEINNLPEDPTINNYNEMIRRIEHINTTIIRNEKVLEPDNQNTHTYCLRCKNNCHSPCSCLLQSLGRCTNFSFFFGCEKCPCPKKDHLQNKFHYVTRQREESYEIFEEIKRQMIQFLRTNREREINNREEFLIHSRIEMNFCSREKERIQIEENKINEDIKTIIITMKLYSERINEIAMNNNSYKTEDEYINNLIDYLGQDTEQEQISYLNKVKNDLKIILDIINEDVNNLENLEGTELYNKIKEIVKSQKDN